MATTEQTTFGVVLDNFTGRRDDKEYEARRNKMYSIHRRNRAYVWKVDKRKRFLDSIHKSYHIPAITVHEVILLGPDGTPRVVREIMDGGNRITTARKIDTDEVGFPVTAVDKAALRAAPITIVVLRGLSTPQQREMFKRMNDPTKVSAGQLYAMSDDASLVQEALAFLEDPTYPERERLDKHFPTVALTDKKTGARKDSDGRTVLANAVGVVAGLLYGPNNITTSFDRQEEYLLKDIDRSAYLPCLAIVLDILDAADEALPDFDKRNRVKQWGLGFVLGAMIYDIKNGVATVPVIREKWRNYIVRVRAKTPDAEEAITAIGGANNLKATRLLRASMRVETFLSDGRLLTKDELKSVHHINHRAEEATEEYDDSEEDEEDNVDE
jgi:hypothetical protein